MLDKVNQPRSIMQVAGSIPIYHRYTLGVAGERFFKAMRDSQQLLASPCPQCSDFFYNLLRSILRSTNFSNHQKKPKYLYKN